MARKRKIKRTKAQVVESILRELEEKQLELVQKKFFKLKEKRKNGR